MIWVYPGYGSFQTTYEELKPVEFGSRGLDTSRFQTTYEELKPPMQ